MADIDIIQELSRFAETQFERFMKPFQLITPEDCPHLLKALDFKYKVNQKRYRPLIDYMGVEEKDFPNRVDLLLLI